MADLKHETEIQDAPSLIEGGKQQGASSKDDRALAESEAAVPASSSLRDGDPSREDGGIDVLIFSKKLQEFWLAPGEGTTPLAREAHIYKLADARNRLSGSWDRYELRSMDGAQAMEARQGGDAEGGSVVDDSAVTEGDVPIPPPPQTEIQVAREISFRCEQCGCRSGAPVDERKPDGSFGPGTLVRCVNCKEVHSPSRQEDRSRSGEGRRPDGQDDELERLADDFVIRVSEWDDRTSPEDWPEALLITRGELKCELIAFAREARGQEDGVSEPRPEAASPGAEGQAPGGWQPIETAPKDGTRLWLYFPSRDRDMRQHVGWWEDQYDEALWIDCTGSMLIQPTYWRPMLDSPPPSQEKSGGRDA